MRVGSVVKVIYSGDTYPSYSEFFAECGAPEMAIRYRGRSHVGSTGEVVLCGSHRRSGAPLFAVEIDGAGGELILAGERALEEMDIPFMPELQMIETDVFSDISLTSFLGI